MRHWLITNILTMEEGVIMKIINEFKNLYRKSRNLNRNFRNIINCKLLKNHDFTIISQNCIGTFIYHDLNKKYSSPTINLYFSAPDFIKFSQRIKYYMNQELNFIEINKEYPVAKLDDITIHFMHYRDEGHAIEKWEERKKRINYDNLFFIMTDRDGCTNEIVQAFEDLPYKNKVIFTSKKYSNIKSAIYLKKYKANKEVGFLHEMYNWSGKRGYEQNFNHIRWLNYGKKR